MLFKANKILEDHIKSVLKEGLSSKSVEITNGSRTKGFVAMKLANTPLSYIYGWDNENDYWLLSEN